MVPVLFFDVCSWPNGAFEAYCNLLTVDVKRGSLDPASGMRGPTIAP